MGCEQFFADVSSKIIALADPVLGQPDIELEMVSPPAGAYIPSFTIYHVLPDLPAVRAPTYVLSSALGAHYTRITTQNYPRAIYNDPTETDKCDVPHDARPVCAPAA